MANSPGISLPEGFASEFSHSPIAFHDPSQIVGAPFLDEDRFIIKFNCFWNIEAPPGYSLLFTHPVNRADLPFTTLTGLVDCDTFHHSPLSFPARWHDVEFNGVLPKGTPVAQCLPVKRESWTGRFEVLSERSHRRGWPKFAPPSPAKPASIAGNSGCRSARAIIAFDPRRNRAAALGFSQARPRPDAASDESALP